MLSSLKQRRFWMLLHRWLGAIILVFAIIAGLTGSAVAFWRDIDSWLNADWYRVNISDNQLSVDKLTSLVKAQYPKSTIHGVILPKASDFSTIFYLAGEPTGIDEVFVNTYTGEILGDRDNDEISLNKRQLMPFLYQFHYNLGLGELGKLFLGYVAVLWLVITLTGLWLAWPKKGKWRKSLSVKTTAGASRMMFDLHRAGGLLVASFFIVILWTGLWWNMDYAMRPLATALLPTTPSFSSQNAEISDINTSIDNALSQAIKAKPTATPYYVRLRSDQALYTVYLRMPEESGPYGRTFAFISYSGDLLFIDEPSLNQVGDSYAEWQLPLHTGQFLGLSGRLLWAVIGLAPLILGITGMWLWLRKSLFVKRK